MARKLSDDARKARAPRRPDELVGALHDRIHHASGRLICANPILVRKESDEQKKENHDPR